MTDLQTERIWHRNEWTDKSAMILPNGTKIIRLESTRELMVVFRYSDQFVTFEFYAQRWDENLDPMDHWEVFLGFAFQFIQSTKGQTVPMDEVRRIAGNIRSALFAWPPAKLEALVPLK